jgi:hypothetical protein
MFSVSSGKCGDSTVYRPPSLRSKTLRFYHGNTEDCAANLSQHSETELQKGHKIRKTGMTYLSFFKAVLR